MNGLKACVVIPARMHSTRLPGKMLLRETGRTLLQHTHEAASRAQLPSAVIDPRLPQLRRVPLGQLSRRRRPNVVCLRFFGVAVRFQPAGEFRHAQAQHQGR